MKGWEFKPLEFIGELTSSKRIYLSEYISEGVPFYRSKEIIERVNGKNINIELFINKNKYNEIQRKFGVPLTGDILITAVGTLGVIYQVRKSDYFYFKDGNILWLRKINNNINKRYIYQLLKSKLGKSLLDETIIGTSQPAYTIANLKKIKIPLPPLPIQKKIAAVLSAYDDLIENNNRRIAILEKMAEELYREWFVRLRFPEVDVGTEQCSVPTSTPNPTSPKGIPEGWEVKKIGDCFITSSGGTPSREKENIYYNGNINWIKTGELKDTIIIETDEKITESGLKYSSAQIYPVNTLIMAMYGVNIGQLGIIYNPSATNQACCAFLPIKKSEYSLYYLFFYLKSIREYLFNISMGAAQQNLSQQIIKRLDYIKPHSKLLTLFDKIQKIYFDKIILLKKQNKILTATRDLLLSRLMSGRIDLENLDISFPASMREEGIDA